MMLHVFFRASVPGVVLLLERFSLSLRSTILTLWAIKKISSLNVNYFGGKSLPNSDLTLNYWGPHNWLLNTWDCQDCINQKISRDQRLEKNVRVTGLTWGSSKRRKNLKRPGQNCSLRQCWKLTLCTPAAAKIIAHTGTCPPRSTMASHRISKQST